MEKRILVGHNIGEAGGMGGFGPMLKTIVKGLQKIFGKS